MPLPFGHRRTWTCTAHVISQHPLQDIGLLASKRKREVFVFTSCTSVSERVYRPSDPFPLAEFSGSSPAFARAGVPVLSTRTFVLRGRSLHGSHAPSSRSFHHGIHPTRSPPLSAWDVPSWRMGVLPIESEVERLIGSIRRILTAGTHEVFCSECSTWSLVVVFIHGSWISRGMDPLFFPSSPYARRFKVVQHGTFSDAHLSDLSRRCQRTEFTPVLLLHFSQRDRHRCLQDVSPFRGFSNSIRI